MPQLGEVFVHVRPLQAHSLRAKQNEAHDEDIQASRRLRFSRNPGDGGERAIAFLADASRARAAGRESRAAG